MKKLLLSTALLASMAIPGAAKDVLSEITSGTGIDHSAFEYNNKGQVVRQETTDMYGKYYMIFKYDGKDQLVRNEAYQDLVTPGEFILVSYVDYQYDDAGRLSQRENYNYDQWGGSGFIKGGRITYSYDEQGRLSLQQTFMSWGSSEELSVKVEYTYNEAGQLAEETTFAVSYANPSEFNPSAKLVYSYNENGQRAEMIAYAYDNYADDPTVPVKQNTTSYTYSADGLTCFEQVSSWGEVNLRIEYSYDSAEASETVYPYDIEAAENNFVYSNAVKRIAGATEYAADWDTGILTLYDKFTYHYQAEGSGLRDIARPSSAAFVTAEDGRIMIGGIKSGDIVSFYNTDGRQVASSIASRNRVAAPALKSGCYIAVTPAGAVKFIVK